MSLFILDSSIGRKLIMSITGVFLILFLLFHSLMNVVVIISPEAYNIICEFLGANWYAIVGTLVLAGGFVVHILYAFLLTFLNWRARGSKSYAISARQKGVEWSSKNMLILGIIILGFLCLHLYNFWFKMQFVELMHKSGMHFGDIENATNGAMYVRELFSNPIYSGLYLVWLAALWFHLTHGVWSALHSLGLNNKTWLPRVKVISNITSTIVVLLFASVVVYYFVSALISGEISWLLLNL